MVRPLMTDTVFLAQKAQPADAGDVAVADDVLTAQQTLLPIRVDNKNSRNILIFVFFQILTMFPIARIIETTSPTVRQERTPFFGICYVET